MILHCPPFQQIIAPSPSNPHPCLTIASACRSSRTRAPPPPKRPVARRSTSAQQKNNTIEASSPLSPFAQLHDATTTPIQSSPAYLSPSGPALAHSRLQVTGCRPSTLSPSSKLFEACIEVAVRELNSLLFFSLKLFFDRTICQDTPFQPVSSSSPALPTSHCTGVERPPQYPQDVLQASSFKPIASSNSP
ncbi:hypothetical protein B0H19DRAFT_1248314 [Mycena capillaripes]|nr:hypothetical protein B0H19DRAFT_1248314 [Mycena capillaripes]